MQLTHRIIERDVHMYQRCRQWTVTRLYSHMQWDIRDDRGELVETFDKLPQCEEWINSHDLPTVTYPV